MGCAEDPIMSDGTAFSHQQGRRGFEDAAQPTLGSYREPDLPLADIAVPEAELAWDPDLKIGRRDAEFSAQRIRTVIIIGTLSATLALGLIGGFQFLVFAPASTAIGHKADCSNHALDSDGASCVASKSDREAIFSAPNAQKVAAPTAMTSGSGSPPSHNITQQAATSTYAETSATHQNAKSPRPRVAMQHERSLSSLTPVPETKPGTIEGWTVREVAGGTALLEGPNGQWRATNGDTVPGLGRVDSIVRWGNRWIVATSKGLVSTP
jgi:hypothetical protein